MISSLTQKNKSGQNLKAEQEYYATFKFEECIEGPYWKDIFSHFHKIAGPSSTVLDVCCGDGSFDLFITLRGYRTIGVDLSKDMLSKRGALFKKYKQPSKSMVADCTRLPFKNASYKTITIISGLHHFPDTGPVLREVARVGAPDAVFFAWEPNLFNPLVWFDYWWRLRVKKDTTYSENEYPINPVSLRAHLKKFFTEVHVYTARALPNTALLDRLDRLISMIPLLNLFGAIIVVVCRNPKK